MVYWGSGSENHYLANNISLMKLFRWLPGRQPGAEYKKFCFLYTKVGRYGFDGYILRYEPKTRLPLHRDHIKGRMWRLNIKLFGNCVFFIENKGGKGYKATKRRINFFRPDIYTHGLFTYTKTYKLSLGFAKFDKHGQDSSHHH